MVKISDRDTVAEDEWVDWVGRVETTTDTVSADHAQRLFASLDDDRTTQDGDALPPGWHWLYFNPFPRRGDLDDDGHPKRGGFLPPVPLPRRMWAGGSVSYRAPITVGASARRRSEITGVRSVSGRSGQLVFVTVQHVISVGDRTCVVEDQNIVYRGQPTADGTPPAERPGEPPAEPPADWVDTITPDPTLLFRYSALTSNGHRIHYDHRYVTEREGYPALVVHGPLTATLLQRFATRCAAGPTLARFDFRGVYPLFVDASITLEARLGEQPEKLDLRAVNPRGVVAMTATASFSTAIGTT